MAACTLRLDHESVVIGARTQLFDVFELRFDLECKALSWPKETSGTVSVVCYIIAIINHTDRHDEEASKAVYSCTPLSVQDHEPQWHSPCILRFARHFPWLLHYEAQIEAARDRLQRSEEVRDRII